MVNSATQAGAVKDTNGVGKGGEAAAEPVVHINSAASFEREVSQFKGVVLVDFWAEWCPPCRAIGPTIHRLAESFQGTEGVKIAKLNVDQAGDVAQRFGIRSIPTAILFRDGKEVDRGPIGILKHDHLKRWVEGNR